MNDELNRRAPAQPEPAVPTPDTFMGEPVLTRWKPLNRDDSRLALHQSMHNRSFGNPSDDKLMLEWLWENGYALCKRVPDEAAPTPQQQALDRMVENAEALGLYEAAPTVVERPQVGETWHILRAGATACATVTVAEITPLTVTFEPTAYGLAGERLPLRNVEFVELAAPATPPRAPLTDAQIDAVTDAQWGRTAHLGHNAEYRAYARAVEAAHGIGTDREGE